MNVKEFAEKLDLKVLVEGDTEREITGCYIGDLLSWVMGRAPEDSAWLTVMGNINSIAVATLGGEYPALQGEQLPPRRKAPRAFELT